jgi:hypothetical protein
MGKGEPNVNDGTNSLKAAAQAPGERPSIKKLKADG